MTKPAPFDSPGGSVSQVPYPRPQLQRDAWTNRDGPWRFAFDHELRYRRPTDVDQWPLNINGPFAPETARSGIGDTRFHPAVWYQRDFQCLPVHTRRSGLPVQR